MTDRHVLVVNHFARPRYLPGGTRHVELFSRLDGWQGRIIAGDKALPGSDWHGQDGLLETVRTIPYSSNGIARVANWLSFMVTAFIRGIRARPLDLVYGSSPHLFAATSAWAIAKLRRVPFVLEIRDVWPQTLVDMGTLRERSIVYRILAALERFLYRQAQHVVYMAEGVADHLRELAVESDHMTFIPNGADPNDFQPSTDRKTLRRRYGFRGMVAIYAGAHGPANGLDFLLDAATKLGAESDISIVLVGDGVDKTRLVNRARSEGLTNVQFMGPVPKSEIPDLLAAADLGVHCLADIELFRKGVSPNKIFDYLASGLAVITNTPGECTQIIHQSQGGIAVAPSDLANGIRHFSRMSPEERASIGKNAKDYMGAERSRSAMAGRLSILLNEVQQLRPR